MANRIPAGPRLSMLRKFAAAVLAAIRALP